MTAPPIKCPTCGAKVQMTVTLDHWFTLVPGDDGQWRWEPYGVSDPGESGPVKVYCENDHDIDANEPDGLAEHMARVIEAVKLYPTPR